MDFVYCIHVNEATDGSATSATITKIPQHGIHNLLTPLKLNQTKLAFVLTNLRNV
jgi:hypothetical protein